MARVAWWAAFVLACGLNLFGLYAPTQPGPAMFVLPHADKLAHLMIFGAVAWTGRQVRLNGWLLGGVLVVHAVTSEIIQGALLPQRSGEVGDLVADLVGIALGLGAATLTTRWRPTGPEPRDKSLDAGS
ncbi:hypothetical protein [Actinopolymorpha alba]|uniref:hypothetical protein n=1 Tax=Actinopolymorpha alba TaxID=533267 RepID=UPI0003823E10|nr:hypothetical protein [Actinopolymorpha alba]